MASRSEELAQELEAGDACAAQEEAAALRSELNDSLRSIPEVYLEDLSGLVNEIAAQLPPCVPPDDDEDEDDEGENDAKDDKDKDKDRDKDKDKKDKGEDGE